MALFPHSLYFIIHTVLDKEIIAKAIDCPWDNGSVLERMRLYGNLPNFP